MIPYLDLRAQYRALKPEIDAAIARVLESGQFVLGSEVQAFETEFAAYHGARHAIAVNSGTSALHLALLAAGIGPGDEVITTPFTFVATVAAIEYAGARPVFVDIDPVTFTLDPALLEAAVTPRTKALIPVHLYGQPADLDAILDVAARHQLTVIEDAAQAHGAQYRGRRVGSFGQLACFSFYPGKNLGAYGEGGLVLTNDPERARTVRLLRDWGAEKRYHYVLKGYNYRMESIQGAVLRVKLRHLDAWNEARRALAARYDRGFAGSGVSTPRARDNARHVYHIYALRVPGRDRLAERLAAQEIQTGIHYPLPLHLLPLYAGLGYRAGQFPCAEGAAKEVLSLPIYPELSETDQQRVIEAVRSILRD